MQSSASQDIRWSRRVRALERPAPDRVIVGLLGDCVIAESVYYRTPQETRTLFGILREADLAVAVLATALADSGAPEAKDVFIGPTIVAEDLVAAGVDIVNIATSHLLDAGPGGLTQTLDALKRAGIDALGGGETLEAAMRPLVRTVKGQRVAFLGFHSALDWERPRGSVAASPNSSGVAPIRARTVRWGFQKPDVLTLPFEADVRAMEGAVRAARRAADVVVTGINAHDGDRAGGEETVGSGVDPGLQLVARAAVIAGSDLVLCSGSHRVQPVERFKGKCIFYGTGSFFFQLFEGGKPAGRYGLFPETQARIRRYLGNPEYFESLLVRAVVADGKIGRIDLVPFVLSPDGVPSMADDERASRILARIKSGSEPLGASIQSDGWHGWLQEGP